MILDIYQIDAFCKKAFTGNPAAIIPLENWLDDRVLQQIAEENNLAETAYIIQKDIGYHIRWFTPTVEVDLCGHATLGAAWVIYNILGHAQETIIFYSKSGELSVRKLDNKLQLDFPADKLTAIAMPSELPQALGAEVLGCYKGKSDYLVVLSSEAVISALNPDISLLKRLGGRGVIVTAKGDKDYDFVSRGFFPQSGIDEDPATGSAHTTLTPYWYSQLGQSVFKAKQLSARGGYFDCIYKQDRILISGQCHLFLKGQIYI